MLHEKQIPSWISLPYCQPAEKRIVGLRPRSADRRSLTRWVASSVAAFQRPSGSHMSTPGGRICNKDQNLELWARVT